MGGRATGDHEPGQGRAGQQLSHGMARGGVKKLNRSPAMAEKKEKEKKRKGAQTGTGTGTGEMMDMKE